MNVKDLKELLNKVPEEMTLEQFDNLPVAVCTNKAFIIPYLEMSGVITFNKDLSLFSLIATCSSTNE